MPEQTQTSVWQRSWIARFLRWFFSWRGIRRLLIVLAWIATLIVLLYSVENWRGRRAWSKMRHQLEARGELLDYKAFVPDPVPAEQNFAATSFIASWFVKGAYADIDARWGDSYSRVREKASASKPSYPPDEKGRRRLTDLAAWASAFEAVQAGTNVQHDLQSARLDRESRAAAAPAVLQGLKPVEGYLHELQSASRRPHSRYPINYSLDDPWGILLPHLTNIKAASQRLELRACARLAVGQTDEALEDVKLILYLADSVKSEPFLISHLVRFACMQIAAQPIWEGLAEHRWSGTQLQQLQKHLQQYDFIADIDYPLDAERAAGVLTADLLYRRKYTVGMLLESGESGSIFSGSFGAFLAGIAPRGWYYQEQVSHCRLHENQLQGAFDAAKRRIYPAQIANNIKEMEREIAGGRLGKTLSAVLSHRFLASLLLPSLGNVPRRVAVSQTVADHAAVACALEQFRFVNGQFPDQLTALVPKFISQLPTDLLTGQPYRYRRTDDGQFLLYSVAWNEKDDGGTPGPRLFDDKEGDWVWQYPSAATAN